MIDPEEKPMMVTKGADLAIIYSRNFRNPGIHAVALGRLERRRPRALALPLEKLARI
jgi:hypothetical protein